MKRQFDSHSHHQSQNDQLIRELQSRESDLNEALQAKDSQLAVLRVRLEETDKELSGAKKSIERLESENQRYKYIYHSIVHVRNIC